MPTHWNILCATRNKIDFYLNLCNAEIMLLIAKGIVMLDFAMSSDHCPCSTSITEGKRFLLMFVQVPLHRHKKSLYDHVGSEPFQRQFILSRSITQCCMVRFGRTKSVLGKLIKWSANQRVLLADTIQNWGSKSTLFSCSSITSPTI